MIRIKIKKQIQGEPVIELYRSGKKLSLVPENVEITNLETSFDVDLQLKKTIRRKKEL